MDIMPITGLDELDSHLDELIEDPNLPLNAKLFDDVELQLNESNIPPLIPRLLPKLTTILHSYTRDPHLLASLTIKLLGPVSFTQILSLASEDSLVQALCSPAPSANLLAMTVLEKAARTPADAAILSTMTGLVGSFLRRWLAAPQVEVGEKGGRVLGDLLDTDCELSPPSPGRGGADMQSAAVVLRCVPGQGKLWRRLFHDREIYSVVIGLCSGRDADTAHDAKQLSLAQGRLLRVLPRLAALNFGAVSSLPSFSPTGPSPLTNGTTLPRGLDTSLLRFAALDMVDTNDELMALSRVDFFEAFVSVLRVTPYSPAKVEAIRALLRDATAGDEILRQALVSLPDRTVPEEAEDLRRWLREVLPGESIRVAGQWG